MSALASTNGFPLTVSPSPPFSFKSSQSSMGFRLSKTNGVCFSSIDSKANTDDGTPKSSRQEEDVRVSTVTRGNSSTSFLSALCPLLRLFSGGDPSRERSPAVEATTSYLATMARFPWGSRASSGSLENFSEPPLRLQLFEFEACPFCRRVREAMTELDLSVEVYPCPKGSVRHREMVRKSGGKEQFPFLVDPNTGISLYESGDIVKYLFKQYGGGRSPTIGLLESTVFTGWMPTILRAGRGMSLWEMARVESAPPIMLELFSYENNPDARIVREALCELEIPYVLQNVGQGSVRTRLFLDTCGSDKVPFLIDHNTGTRMGDFKNILAYLFDTYSIATV